MILPTTINLPAGLAGFGGSQGGEAFANTAKICILLVRRRRSIFFSRCCRDRFVDFRELPGEVCRTVCTKGGRSAYLAVATCVGLG